MGSLAKNEKKKIKNEQQPLKKKKNKKPSRQLFNPWATWKKMAEILLCTLPIIIPPGELGKKPEFML